MPGAGSSVQTSHVCGRCLVTCAISAASQILREQEVRLRSRAGTQASLATRLNTWSLFVYLVFACAPSRSRPSDFLLEQAAWLNFNAANSGVDAAATQNGRVFQTSVCQQQLLKLQIIGPQALGDSGRKHPIVRCLAPLLQLGREQSGLMVEGSGTTNTWRPSICWFMLHMATATEPGSDRRQELLSGFPGGYRCPSAWRILCCFPRHILPGSWIRSGAS